MADSRTKRIGLRVSEGEYNLLRAAAEHNRMSVSEYVRRLVITFSIEMAKLDFSGEVSLSLFSSTADFFRDSVERKRVLESYEAVEPEEKKG